MDQVELIGRYIGASEAAIDLIGYRRPEGLRGRIPAEVAGRQLLKEMKIRDAKFDVAKFISDHENDIATILEQFGHDEHLAHRYARAVRRCRPDEATELADELIPILMGILRKGELPPLAESDDRVDLRVKVERSEIRPTIEQFLRHTMEQGKFKNPTVDSLLALYKTRFIGGERSTFFSVLNVEGNEDLKSWVTRDTTSAPTTRREADLPEGWVMPEPTAEPDEPVDADELTATEQWFAETLADKYSNLPEEQAKAEEAWALLDDHAKVEIWEAQRPKED